MTPVDFSNFLQNKYHGSRQISDTYNRTGRPKKKFWLTYLPAGKFNCMPQSSGKNTISWIRQLNVLFRNWRRYPDPLMLRYIITIFIKYLFTFQLSKIAKDVNRSFSSVKNCQGQSILFFNYQKLPRTR